MASALLNLSSSQSKRRKGKEEERGRGRERELQRKKHVKKKTGTSRTKERKRVVMRMAKLECARAVGWMREIEARGSVPENRGASIYSYVQTYGNAL